MAIYFPPVGHVPLARPYAVTPVALTVAGAYLTYVYCFLTAWSAPLLAGGAAAALMYLLGPTPQQIAFALAAAFRRAVSMAGRLVPRTPVEWGVTAVVGAFAFLALGAAVSLRKVPPPPEAPVPAEAS